MKDELASADAQAIRAVHEAWLAAELRGDVDGVLALCTADVRWLGPERPPLEGKQAIGRWLRTDRSTIEDIHTTDLRIDGSRTIACKTCSYQTRYRAGENLAAEVARGKHLWILRKSGGDWKVMLVMWQPELAA